MLLILALLIINNRKIIYDNHTEYVTLTSGLMVTQNHFCTFTRHYNFPHLFHVPSDREDICYPCSARQNKGPVFYQLTVVQHNIWSL